MKKLLCVITVTIMAILLTGCNNASGITESTTQQPTKPVATTPVQTTAPTTPPTTPAPTTPPTTPAPTTPPTTPAPTEPTTAEPVDELAALRISESEAKSKGGAYLKRNGKLYECPKSFWLLNGYSFSRSETPVPIVAASDQVIGYFSSGNGEISLTKIDFIGYTIPILAHYGMEMEVKQMGDMTTIRVGDLSQITIVDKNGQPVSAEDVRNLNYGEEYTVYWYTGTQYNEVKMIANCSYYRDDNSFKRIKIAAELTKNGYAIYDFSQVPAGTYDGPTGIFKIE